MIEISEEEKKAINRLNHINDFRTVYLQKGCQTMNDIETILNLVKKQQEEIEKRDEIIKEMIKEYDFFRIFIKNKGRRE